VFKVKLNRKTLVKQGKWKLGLVGFIRKGKPRRYVIMGNIQKQFLDYHADIKLDDENKILREKREIILTKLKNKIDSSAPTYTPFVQGSYAMSTGIKPINGEYDIDVGLFFDMSKEDYDDPVEAKRWVYDALNGYPHNVEMKTPCVTVTYKENGQPAFHVDLTIYSANNPDGKIYLAKGRLNSSPENKFWEESDPKRLSSIIRDHCENDEDRAQFRRVIRYLKRWKDLKFPATGHAAPTGIALTVAAINYFSPVSELVDIFANKRAYNDLVAFKNFLNNLINAFQWVEKDDGSLVERLVVNVPTPIYNDLFERMTDTQMANFKTKLIGLRDTLMEAEAEVDPVEACKILQKKLDPSFPVPPKEETGKRKAMAITTGSSSA
jgi:hypothetical protein